MVEKKAGFIAWARDRKKQLAIAGIVVTASIGAAVFLKSKGGHAHMWASLEKVLGKAPQSAVEPPSATQAVSSMFETSVRARPYASPQKPFDVSGHIRTLSGGRHHSAEKAAEAAAMGIVLSPDQTLVSPYIKFAA